MEFSVATTVLDFYEKLPSNCKARDGDEFTVIAAIVAEVPNGDYKVISMASGTKCVGTEVCDSTGCIIHDSHAEVLARRGFNRYLLSNILAIMRNPSHDTYFVDNIHCPVQAAEDETLKYRIKSGWSFYLYVSDPPCGDASIYDIGAGTESSFTGAKLTVQSARESNDQALGVVRTKSGRSDISAERRTTSMSCSDKIARWVALGLQSPLLSLWMEPVYLSGIVMGRDPAAASDESQLKALKRAVNDRVKQLTDKVDLPSLSIVSDEDCQFTSSKSIMKYNREVKQKRLESETSGNKIGQSEPAAKKRKYVDSLNPCGYSVNWLLDLCLSCHTSKECIGSSGSSNSAGAKKKKERTTPCQGGSVEVTIAHTGLLQGMTKGSESKETASRLSRCATLSLFVETAVAAWNSADEKARKVVEDFLVRCGGDSSNGVVDPIAALNSTPYYLLKKHCNAVYSEKRAAFLASDAFQGWLVDDPLADSGSITNG